MEHNSSRVQVPFLAIALATLVGCVPEVPEGAYQPATLPAAVALAGEHWGIKVNPNNVFLVKADCVPHGVGHTLTGFSFKGRCAWGVEIDGLVFVSDRGQNRYSGTSLVHETAHLKHKDGNHTLTEVWGDRTHPWWPSGGYVMAGSAFLARNPAADTINPAQVVK